MQLPLKNIFTTRICNSFDFGFEEFIKELFLLRYGVADFIPTRPKKDKGCDGIITSSNTIVACFGPKKYNQTDFQNKAKADYAEYQKHWQKKYSNWLFVVNHQISPLEITFIDKLHKGSIPLGVDSLMHIIENELTVAKHRKMADYLSIGKEYFTQEYLSEILDDLLNGASIDTSTIIHYKGLVGPEHKIVLNYDTDDVDAAMQEFSSVIGEFPKIDALIKHYESFQQSAIKTKIITDYKNANGSFKERLKIITDIYLEKYSNLSDNDYQYYITAVLIYLFEQCLIGKKTDKE
ncbi:MAG: hypothetical protein A2046_13840 [Bacteroidetes bacterium GWA2_30_7]|nr:MAG: hypothetical protein A2046_13840 [Bacteroidetes bacterium GWA2_30_7]